MSHGFKYCFCCGRRSIFSALVCSGCRDSFAEIAGTCNQNSAAAWTWFEEMATRSNNLARPGYSFERAKIVTKYLDFNNLEDLPDSAYVESYDYPDTAEELEECEDLDE